MRFFIISIKRSRTAALPNIPVSCFPFFGFEEFQHTPGVVCGGGFAGVALVDDGDELGLPGRIEAHPFAFQLPLQGFNDLSQDGDV